MTSTSASPATEIAYIPLKEKAEIEDPTTPAGKAWNEALDIIRSQDGYQQSYYGRQIEHPDTLMWLIDWTSPESHIKFMNSPSYKVFLEKINHILSSPPQLQHFLPSRFPPTLLSTAPCIEFATFYGTEPHFLSNVQAFIQALDTAAADIEGYEGSVYGSVVEKISKRSEPEQEKADAVVLCIGWKSKDHHLKFRDQNPLFKENIWRLREGNHGAEVVHVPFKVV